MNRFFIKYLSLYIVATTTIFLTVVDSRRLNQPSFSSLLEEEEDVLDAAEEVTDNVWDNANSRRNNDHRKLPGHHYYVYSDNNKKYYYYYPYSSKYYYPYSSSYMKYNYYDFQEQPKSYNEYSYNRPSVGYHHYSNDTSVYDYYGYDDYFDSNDYYDDYYDRYDDYYDSVDYYRYDDYYDSTDYDDYEYNNDYYYHFAASTMPIDKSGVYSDTIMYIQDDLVCLIGSATGLESNIVSIHEGGKQCSATNGCGVHIHEGFSCEDTELQGGHYWNSYVLKDDPWATIGYTKTNSFGESNEYEMCVQTGFYDLQSDPYLLNGRAFIIHAEDGSRVSCGLIYIIKN